MPIKFIICRFLTTLPWILDNSGRNRVVPSGMGGLITLVCVCLVEYFIIGGKCIHQQLSSPQWIGIGTAGRGPVLWVYFEKSPPLDCSDSVFHSDA